MLPEYTNAHIEKGSWEMPEIFPLMKQVGEISEHGMYNTFNMGIGMMVAVDPSEAETALAALKEAGQKAWCIGVIEESKEQTPGVIL